MKFLPAQFAYLLQGRSTRRDLHTLGRFLVFLATMIVVYSVVFHFLMAAEGQEHSWITGFYWTLTVMSTLGFGDITFESDLGRLFSIVVLLSGVLFLLVVLPFTFIQFFYAPWLEAQSRLRAPRSVPEGTRGHVILTYYDPVALSLVQRLEHHGRPYVLLEPDLGRALELYDQGIHVVVGERDKFETYRALCAADASLVVCTGDDHLNTNIAFSVRELSPSVPIVSIARADESLDILEMAGSSHVLHLPDMLGRALARRTLGGDVRANVIGRFGELVIAEAPATGTPLVGKTIGASRLREVTGLTIAGIWNRGQFEIPHADTRIETHSVLVFAGTEEQLARFSELTVIYNLADAPVLILGGGRVGRATARALSDQEIPYRIVEKRKELVRDPGIYVHGSAAEREVLEEAGISQAGTVIVTTSEDPTNIYLTVYCRRLRPDVQIVSRATLERNVPTLHLAGADFVMSYASMGANAIYNILESGDVVMLAEGLDVFRVPVPSLLAGRPLDASGIREETGCSVVAFEYEGRTIANPPPDAEIPTDPAAELILIGSTESERRFIKRFGSPAHRPRRRVLPLRRGSR